MMQASEEGSTLREAPEKHAPTASPSTIQIYARVRPTRPNSKLHITPERYWCSSGDQDQHHVGFRIPKDQAAGMINNQREVYDFKFDRVFDMDAKQEEVFDTIAKPVVASVMDGYNGTIFAYGQTGSGKTFTITGGAERYNDRGLIPRTLQFIFKEAQKRHDFHYEVSVSYLEIYNEVGYDLLDNSRDAKKLEDLPKVSLQEDEEGRIHLRNLANIPAKDEEEALNLLFVGDTTRMIAETPSNPASSRSHCLFIISITSRREGEAQIRRGKLHLVDLAGSERVGRTGIGGNLLKEAKYINLSLHYLEQVIIALHEKSLGKRAHIPYRNSMMTSVLRDSLGGNCRTTMIATLAVEDELIDESISTCRFAQRVALIANNATLNEELDPRMVITKLKREVTRLKAELAIARGEAGQHEGEELPGYERDKVKQAVDDYIGESSMDAALIFNDFRKINEAFRIMKQYIIDGRDQQVAGRVPIPPSTSTSPVSSFPPSSVDGATNLDNQEIERLRKLIAHRDNEINILVGMMNQRASNAEIGSNSLNPIENGLLPTRDESPQSLGGPSAVSSMPSQYNQATNQVALRRNGVPQLTTEKAKAFEIFKQGYPAGDWIDSQKSLLKTKYGEAKALGEKANGYRNEIKTLKARLQSETMDDEAAQQLRITVVDLSTKYKGAYEQLKDLKSEIEHLQHLLEQARLRLTRDFEYWYVNVYLATESPPSQASSDSSSMDVHNVPDFHANVRASDSTLQLGSNYDSRRYMQQDVDSRGRIEESKIPSTSKIGNTIGTTFLEASSMKQPVTEEEPRSRRLEAYNSHTIAPTIMSAYPMQRVPSMLPKYVYPADLTAPSVPPQNPTTGTFTPLTSLRPHRSSTPDSDYTLAATASPAAEQFLPSPQRQQEQRYRHSSGDSMSSTQTYYLPHARPNGHLRTAEAAWQSPSPQHPSSPKAQIRNSYTSASIAPHTALPAIPNANSSSTGESVNEDIQAFYRIRDGLMKRMGRGT